MKNSICLLIAMQIFVITNAQTFPTKDGKVFYEHVDTAADGTAAQLYDKAKIWLANIFNDSKEVIQVDNKESHTIIGKGLFQFTQTMTPYNVRFTFQISTKDNRSRIQLYDIMTEQGTMRIKRTAEKWNEVNGSGNIKRKINEGFTEMIESFKKSMAKKEVDF